MSGLGDTRVDHVDRPCPGTHPAAAIPAGQPIWCLDCERRITDALRPPAAAPGILGIADLAAAAAARRDGRLLTVAPAVARRGPGRTTPSTSPAWDEVDATARWATEWATRLATHLGHPVSTDPTGIDQARNPPLHTALAYLATWLRPALVSPAAEDFGADVLHTHRLLQRLAGEHVQRRRLRVDCPACAAPTVIREDGRDLLTCIACTSTWTEDDFQTALSATAS